MQLNLGEGQTNLDEAPANRQILALLHDEFVVLTWCGDAFINHWQDRGGHGYAWVDQYWVLPCTETDPLA